MLDCTPKEMIQRGSGGIINGQDCSDRAMYAALVSIDVCRTVTARDVLLHRCIYRISETPLWHPPVFTEGASVSAAAPI